MSTHLHPLIADPDEYEKTILHAPEIPPFCVYNPHKKSCWAKSGEQGIKLSLEDTDKVFYFKEAEAKGIHRWQTSKAAMRCCIYKRLN